MLTLGLRAHDFMISDDLEQLTQTIADNGVRVVQFANGISLPHLSQNGRGISAGLGLQVNQMMQAKKIQIGVLSSYINLIDPDETKQAANIAQFKQYLTLAGTYGAHLVATEPGSLDPEFKPTTRNYTPEVVQKTIANVQTLVTTAEKVGQLVGIEAGINHPIHSLETIDQLLKTVDSPNLKIILDPVNLLNEDNKGDLYQILEEGLARFGDAIYAVHVKDYQFETTKDIMAPGTGVMDFERFFKIMARYQPAGLVILDEAPREGLEAGIQLLQETIERLA